MQNNIMLINYRLNFPILTAFVPMTADHTNPKNNETIINN